MEVENTSWGYAHSASSSLQPSYRARYRSNVSRNQNIPQLGPRLLSLLLAFYDPSDFDQQNPFIWFCTRYFYRKIFSLSEASRMHWRPQDRVPYPKMGPAWDQDTWYMCIVTGLYIGVRINRRWLNASPERMIHTTSSSSLLKSVRWPMICTLRKFAQTRLE